MNVLIVGGGGREHAIAWALSKSEQVEQLYCAPGNGGIAALAQCVPLSATDVDGVVAWAQAHSIDFVVVAPGRSPRPGHGGCPGGCGHSRLRPPGGRRHHRGQQNLFQESDGQVPHSNRKVSNLYRARPCSGLH